jgi:hypothetical protein
MTSKVAGPLVLVLLTAAACSEPPAQPQMPASSATRAAAVAEPPKSEAIARADAMLEDLKRREAAQAKFDRDNPPAARVPIPAMSAALPKTPAPASAAVAAPPATTAPTPAPGAAAAPARDASWWQGQMQTLRLALDQASARLAEAEKENYKYAYEDLQAEYKKRVAAVAEARRALERLHDDARRAGVPPGWLR